MGTYNKVTLRVGAIKSLFLLAGYKAYWLLCMDILGEVYGQWCNQLKGPGF